MNKQQQPPRPGPAGGNTAAIVFGLAKRLRVPSLTERHDSTGVMGLFAFVNGAQVRREPGPLPGTLRPLVDHVRIDAVTDLAQEVVQASTPLMYAMSS